MSLIETQGGKATRPVAILGLAALALAMFGDVLFSSRPAVLSAEGADLHGQFLPWYEFGFGELRKGNLPLWNPHLFSGLPFLAGFQSALFYPPNLLFLVLPGPRAANVLIALDVFLAGLFMLLWALHRGLHPVAGFVAAAILMFSGPFFLHVYAGHLPHLSTMAWVPLLFLAVDAFLTTRRPGWCLAGAGAGAMMILAGYPQHVFTAGIAVGGYALLRLARERERPRAVGGLLAIAAGASALAAVQLLPGLAAVAQSVRGGGVPYDFAATGSFPPENFLTLLMPDFFGRMVPLTYWGRWYPWETTLFFGVAGFALAANGIASGGRHAKRLLLPMVLLMLLLALGSYTPLFRILLAAFPGFNKFRGPAKFNYETALFVALLAGVGLDRLIRAERRPLRLAGVLAAAGAGLGVLAILLARAGSSAPPWLHEAMQAVLRTGETYREPGAYSDPAFVAAASAGVLQSLLVAAGTMTLVAILLVAVGRGRRSAYGIAVLAVAEIFLFARASRTTFSPEAMRIPRLERVLQESPGDYRVLNPVNPDAAMILGAQDVWGYDHGVTRRYAEFMFFTQGRDPGTATQNLDFATFNPLYRMLRLRYALLDDGDRLQKIDGDLPRLLLVQNALVLQGRDRILAAMGADFDPEREVILETPPSPAPVPSGSQGNARIVDSSTDELTIEADVPAPSVLVITDGFDPGWRAESLPGSSQSSYLLLPANYVLRAVPLGSGRHHLRLVYRAAGLRLGAWISCLSLAAYLALAAWCRVRARRAVAGNLPACGG